MQNNPIAVFDSGFGGLTVLNTLRRLLPSEDFIYMGDTARVPYGTRSPETVVKYSAALTDVLLTRGVKLIVIACNTIDAWAHHIIADKASRWGVPVVGVIRPGCQQAAQFNQGAVLVIATPSTIRSGVYQRGLRDLGFSSESVWTKACPAFVSVAEEGWVSGEIPDTISDAYLKCYQEHQDDLNAIILGCTHFPLLRESIAKTLPGLPQVDPADPAARKVQRILEERDLLRKSQDLEGTVSHLVTDAPWRFREVGSNLADYPMGEIELVRGLF